MTRQPEQWSFTATPKTTRTRRRVTVAGIAVLLILSIGVVTWWWWPEQQATQTAQIVSNEPKSRLDDKPPTVILNALDPASLYPPGYVDFDPSQQQSDGEPFNINLDYESTSTPPGCTSSDNPLDELRFNFTDDTPGGYGMDAGFLLVMYPVDDPGGNAGRDGEDRTSFTISADPAHGVTNFDTIRDWYERCRGSEVTQIVTEQGRFVRESSWTNDAYLVPAPESAAEDSFAMAIPDRDICDFYGLIRGMLVNVSCPPAQRATGEALFRKVVLGIHEI